MALTINLKVFTLRELPPGSNVDNYEKRNPHWTEPVVLHAQIPIVPCVMEEVPVKSNRPQRPPY
jgi:hypothetical protein